MIDTQYLGLPVRKYRNLPFQIFFVEKIIEKQRKNTKAINFLQYLSRIYCISLPVSVKQIIVTVS